MFLTYAYSSEGPAVLIRGALQVEFNYCEGYRGTACFVDPSVDVLRGVADSAGIVDEKGKVIGTVELLTEEQKAAWGEHVLKDCRGDITEACEVEGRRQSSREAMLSDRPW